MTNQTFTEFIPYTVTISQNIWTMLSNAKVLDDFSLLQAFLGLFALGIIVDVIIYLRTGQWFHDPDFRG
jgi:hypothetical protein